MESPLHGVSDSSFLALTGRLQQFGESRLRPTGRRPPRGILLKTRHEQADVRCKVSWEDSVKFRIIATLIGIPQSHYLSMLRLRAAPIRQNGDDHEKRLESNPIRAKTSAIACPMLAAFGRMKVVHFFIARQQVGADLHPSEKGRRLKPAGNRFTESNLRQMSFGKEILPSGEVYPPGINQQIIVAITRFTAGLARATRFLFLNLGHSPT